MGQPVSARRQQAADEVVVAAAQGKLRLAGGQAAGKEVPEYFPARGIGLPLEGMENHADFLQDVAFDDGDVFLREGKGADPGQEFGRERVYVPDEVEAAALGRSVFLFLRAVVVEGFFDQADVRGAGGKVVQDKLEVFKYDGGGIEADAVFFQEFRAEQFVAGGFHVQAGQQVAQEGPRFPRGDVLVPAWEGGFRADEPEPRMEVFADSVAEEGGFRRAQSRLMQAVQHVRLYGIVPVHKGGPASLRHGEPRVARGAYAPVVLVDGGETGILPGIFVQNGSALVRGTVIDADAFPVRQGLVPDGVQAVSEEGAGTVNGDDDGKKGGHGEKAGWNGISVPFWRRLVSVFRIAGHPRGSCTTIPA